MKLVRQAVVFSAVLFFIFVFVITNLVVGQFVRERWRRARFGNALLQKFCRLGLWLMRIHVRPVNLPKEPIHGLYVGNHLGYIDVLVLSAFVKTSFVTSMEIKETPVLGLLCQMAGCLFVERRNKTNILSEIREIQEALQRGINVTIFPEATSTNGEQIVRFRKPLYLAAMGSNSPVVPFCLNYVRAGGQPLTLKNRDDVFWYGDMSFAPHLWRFIGCFGVEVDLVFQPTLISSNYGEVADLVKASQDSVESVFKPVIANQ